MDRIPITAAVVEETDRLLAQGVDHAVISARLGITEYVVGVMAGDELRAGRHYSEQCHSRRAIKPSRAIDAATIRMIQRMLEVRILSPGQIAREAGISGNVVNQVAKGQRSAVSTERPYVFKDLEERFLPESIRCSGCHGMIAIVPCRVCRARREKSPARR